MVVIYLWDCASYGPTRFVIGCSNMAAGLASYFKIQGYEFEWTEMEREFAADIASSRSEDEIVRTQKWMKKFWNIVEH